MASAVSVEPPVYTHLPTILGPDGAKLSKRHGAVDIREYEDQGFLLEAMLNYLVRLGLSHGDQEIFSVDEMIGLFDVIDAKSAKEHLRPVILDPFRVARDRLAALEHWGQTAIHEATESAASDFDINLASSASRYTWRSLAGRCHRRSI
jgi:glutamyl/glutaminyl-tRNA synthetase